MIDWIPFHSRLCDGPKKSWPRAARFILLELALKARGTRGVIDFPASWDLLKAVHDLIGGDRREIRKALTLFQIRDDLGQTIIEIDRDVSKLSLRITKWEQWAGPKSGAERQAAYKENKRLAECQRHPPVTEVTPTVHNSTEHNRRESDAREAEAPERESGVMPAVPSEAAPESGYDLAHRVFGELWQAKYRRPYAWSPKLGPGSEGVQLRGLGDLAKARDAGRAEAFVRHWVSSYLRDRDAWVVDKSHPVMGLTTVRINAYGEPRRKSAQVAPVEPDQSNCVPASRMVDLAKMVAGIGKGAA